MTLFEDLDYGNGTTASLRARFESNEPWDEDELIRLTHSSGVFTARGCREDRWLMLDMLEDAAITASVIEIESTRVDDRFSTGSTGNSDAHGRLKWMAARWLHSRGEENPEYEREVSFGRCDVWAPKLEIPVECGDTEAIRIADGLAYGYKEVVLLPYNYISAPNTKIAVVFTGDDNRLADFACLGAFNSVLLNILAKRIGKKLSYASAPSLLYTRAMRGVGVTNRVSKWRDQK